MKEDLLARLVGLAERNNQNKNFPLTIVKVADYLEDCETVNRERIYLVFNQYVLPEFKEVMFDFVSQIIQREFKGRAQISVGENFVEFWGVGDQLSRKVTASFMESVVEAFNEYYYSPDTGLYVKREFLKASEEVKKAAAKLRIQLSVDREGRINNITYHEAKKLFEHLGLTMMSLSEYWLVLKEAEASHDEQMLSHLRSRGFVELLDTVILDGKVVIDHPQVTFTDEEPNYLGERHEVVIPQALPGLIYPEDIDFKTGFPKVVHGSTHFDKRTWRYWSPDAPVCIATRGHIFLLDQPALDTKIHPDDALKNLGIRPCCYKVKPPKVEIVQEEKGIRAVINKE